MILSTWDFECESTKTMYFHYVRHPMSLFMLFAFTKSILSVRTVKINENNAGIISLLLGLFPIRNRYPKGSTRHWLPSVQYFMIKLKI